MVSNKQFLDAIFGNAVDQVHVTSFTFSPDKIPKGQEASAWAGHAFGNRPLNTASNQYFCLSTFSGTRRKKETFDKMYCIVLDDVKEKLNNQAEIDKLPTPSWILETSPGSEQWGYILDKPCADRQSLEALINGLIASDMMSGKDDPGMRSVTRYMRLPEGTNNKAGKGLCDDPFSCELKAWEPSKTYSLQQIASPFEINLNARSNVKPGSNQVDHPIANMPDIITVIQDDGQGKLNIKCPWISDHTGGTGTKSSTAVWTRDNGTVGFSCFHSACSDKNARDLIDYVDNLSPGFEDDLMRRRILHDTRIDCKPGEHPLSAMIAHLRTLPRGKEADKLAETALGYCIELKKADRAKRLEDIRDVMNWKVSVLNECYKEAVENQQKIADKDVSNRPAFYKNYIFVGTQNSFYKPRTGKWLSQDGFVNMHGGKIYVKQNALEKGWVERVDDLAYEPGEPEFIVKNDERLGNIFRADSMDYGKPPGKGETIDLWLNHFDTLGWSEHKEHLVNWMAFTIQHPEIKINHAIMLGGKEGIGKDFLLYPLVKCMGTNSATITGEELTGNFQDGLIGKKHIGVNEISLSNRYDANAINNKLKPLLAAPPDALKINPKGRTAFSVRNILSVSMTTNSSDPIAMLDESRRYFFVWSDLNMLSPDHREESKKFWRKAWAWMKDGGWQHVAHYLTYDVDVSNFDPGDSPEVTDALSEVIERSKSPLYEVMQELFEEKYASFQCDIVTARDIARDMRDRATQGPIGCSPSVLNALLIGKELKEMSSKSCRTNSLTMYIIRNHEKHAKTRPCDLVREMEEQRTEMEKRQAEMNNPLYIEPITHPESRE